MPLNSEALCNLVHDALDDLKGTDISVLDVRELTDMTDFMVIASGRSGRHVRSLAENVQVKAKAAGVVPLGCEGAAQGDWVLVDLCDVVVHVMQPDARELYQLEKLWSMPDADSGSSVQGDAQMSDDAGHESAVMNATSNLAESGESL
jgi:ribosome-associated protein